MKTCTCCKLEKSIENYYFDKRRGQYYTQCKGCLRKKATKRRKEDPQYLEKRRVIARKSYKKHKESPKNKYRDYKHGAKKRNLSFDLTYEEFMLYWQSYCIYCGSYIDTVGIDRLNTLKGYSLQNCVPCCSACNIVKNGITLHMCEKVLMLAKERNVY